ncbi:hypothetical protein BJ508DRAFT_134295 [Ascobolus immersus RN42]|uniref:Nephrocystin 3-like N-terminal domain-containing protein n=1 Tax=Ascobolus immersus RN42 TaxID=1160509 RepID=A0A3N4IXT6_ASCIM|nr:hypothetical protein BJ508DRAFT_134295 [Ascobolus immersus RN42]
MKSQLDKLQQGNEQAAHGSQQLQLEEPHPIQTESKAASGRKKRPKKKPQIKPSCPQRLQASLLAYITQRNHNGLVLTDVEESLHSTATLPKSEQNRLGWITKADQLRQWLTSAEGGALLIHANSSIDGRVSVTTVLSSMLVRALQSESIRIVHVLAFFCGIHANLDDEDNDIHSGPVALIESLLDQLLRQPEENFSFDLSRLKKDMVKRATEGSLKCLVDLFVELVSQLRAEVVLFIIIDAVCYYEEDDIIDDTATILNELIVLATDPESRYCRCTVKLLLTTPTRTSALHEAFEEENLLEAPLNIDRGSELALLGGTPSCMKAKASDSDVPEVEYLESESEIYIST